MIVDRLERFSHYFEGLEDIGKFLSSLGPDAPEGRHELAGEDVFAVISRYETRPRNECRPEAHRKYVDIQFLIQGSEVIERFPLQALSIAEPHDEENDVAFFKRPEDAGTRVVLSDKVFAVFFPHDAHMPQVQDGPTPEGAIKVVVKIKAELL